MKVTCEKCDKEYDDTYRLTYCPHEWFEMHTKVHGGDGRLLGIARDVDELRELMNKE